MTESEFNEYVDRTLMSIEDAIEDAELDIDYETAGGILTLDFENGSKIIINRQAPVQQLWVAAKSGGFHFDWDVDKGWVLDADGEALSPFLNRVCSEQYGDTVNLEDLA